MLAGLLGYVVLAIGIGASLGLLANPNATQLSSLNLFILLVICSTAVFAARRWLFTARKVHQQLAIRYAYAAAVVLIWFLLVIAAESIVSTTLPTPAAMLAGLSLGIAMLGLWIESTPTLWGAKVAVIMLYLACSLIAVATLLTTIPSSTFWVVSAVIPAWQARRLAMRGELAQSYLLVNASIRTMTWVLLVALMLPALLQMRA
jgi:hypothetical protein